jgi:hypothetical protein
MYMQHVLDNLPLAESVEDIEALLPWHVELGGLMRQMVF